MATLPSPNASTTHDEQATVRPKIRPTKTLPTDRITFAKQLELLKAWAAASSPPGTAVSNGAVADFMKLNSSTISLANPFFASIGLLIKSEGGYIPSPEVVAYHRAAEYSDNPSHKLAPLMRDSWFGMALLPKLSFRPLSENEALAVLHDTATASNDYRPQIKMLLEYLIAGGVAQRDGDFIKSAKPVFEFKTSDSPSTEQSRSGAEPENLTPAKQNVATAYAATPEGGISFHINVQVSMDQFATWQPERITAFFGGVAQMLAAKAKIEGVG
jgi:hypothetical protein